MLEEVGGAAYVPHPEPVVKETPAPAPSQPQINELRGRVTSAQAQYTSDRATLQSRQSTLTSDRYQYDHPGISIRFGEAGLGDEVSGAETQVNAAQGKVKEDQLALDRARADLASALAAQTAAFRASNPQTLLPQRMAQAIRTYHAAASHAPAAPSLEAAGRALQNATFNEEVMTYEQTHGGKYAVAGSAQWRDDARSLLNDAGAVETARDVVAVRHAAELRSNGLDLQHFGADEWAGESVQRAVLAEQQDEQPPDGSTPTLGSQQQGEQDALDSLSTSLGALSTSGVDPTLGRAALMANGYVSTLAAQVQQTMRELPDTQGGTSAGAIGFLYQTVSSPSLDPQLAAAIVAAAAPVLKSDLKSQSGASTDQAAQAYASTAGIYDVLLDAQQNGVAGAGSLAGEIALESYAAANATDSSYRAGRAGRSQSELDKLLPEVLTRVQQQQLPANLLHAWAGSSAGHGAPAAVDNTWHDNAQAWGTFQSALAGNAKLAARPLPPASALEPETPALTSDEVHASYDQALDFLTQAETNGALPAGIDPALGAAVQTMMSAGYGSKDQVALARAMIAGKQQQLNAAWQQQHAGQGVLMPVDFLTWEASSTISRLGPVLGSTNKTWGRDVADALKGMEAPLPCAPPTAAIDATSAAYEQLQVAQASGNRAAIGTAQEALDKALANELGSVYPDQFPGQTLVSNDENGDWLYLSEVQVMRDHADNAALLQHLSTQIQASEITELSFAPGATDQQRVLALDESLAPLQQAGAGSGNAVAQAVLDDGRVRDLIDGQVSAATKNTSAEQPTLALAQEAGTIAPYENDDPNGPVARQIVARTVGSAVTQQILANAKSGAAQSQDPLGTAAPLMQAAQLSPSLTLAVYHAFDPASATPAVGAAATSSLLPVNALISAAGRVQSAADYRNLAIIYAALPDDVQTVGVPAQIADAQAAKSSLLSAFGSELSQPHAAAAQDLKSWIRASFRGPDSAPAWLASDLATGYQYQQGDKIRTVGKLTQRDVVASIESALYQPKADGSAAASNSSSVLSPDFLTVAGNDGSTLQEFSSQSALTSYVAEAYGLRAASGSDTIVYGQTRLGDLVGALKRAAGVTTIGTSNAIVLQAAPDMVAGQLGSQFRVQTRDGSTVWLGANGAITPDWEGQDAALTRNLSSTVVQVVGGVSEDDAAGDANPLLKIDTPPPPPAAAAHRPFWESIAEDAAAMTVGIVGSIAFDPAVGIALAFATYQAFDTVTNDGQETVFKFGDDLIRGKATFKKFKQFAVDSGTELISSAADALGPEAASLVAAKIGGTAALAATTATAEAAVSETAVTAATDAVTAGAETTGSETVAAVDEPGTAAAESGVESSAPYAAGAPPAVSAARMIGRQALATATAAATQQGVQAAAQVVNAAIEMSPWNHARAQPFSWSALGNVAAEQALDVGLAFPTGGIAGFLPANLAAQLVGGFGSGVAQSEVNDRIFENHDLTRQDMLAALIMTVPGTAQHYADRPGGAEMIRRLFGRASPPASSSGAASSGGTETRGTVEPPPPLSTTHSDGPTASVLPLETETADEITAEADAGPPPESEYETEAETGAATGTDNAAESTGRSVFSGASPRAQTAFDALAQSDSAWTPYAWESVNDYISESLQSPNPGVRAAAQEAREALGDPSGESRGFILSGPEGDALGALVGEDIRVTQQAALAAHEEQSSSQLDTTLALPDDSAATRETAAAVAVVPADIAAGSDLSEADGLPEVVPDGRPDGVPDATTAAVREKLRDLPRTVARAAARTASAISDARSVVAKAAMTAVAAAVSVRDPVLAHQIMTSAVDIAKYTGGQLLNTDGVDWISRSMMLAYKEGTDIWDRHFGVKRLGRVFDGDASKRDLRLLELNVKRYVRSNFDPADPSTVKQSRTETLAAISDYKTIFGSATAARENRDEVTAALRAALAGLHGISSDSTEAIAEHLYSRWENRLRNRLFNSSFNTFTRTMNIIHNVQFLGDSSQDADFLTATRGLVGGRTSAPWMGSAGVVGDDIFYLPALTVEVSRSTSAALTDFARLASRYLHMSGAVGPTRAWLQDKMSTPRIERYRLIGNVVGELSYIPACLSWGFEDMLVHKSDAAKWLADWAVDAYSFVSLYHTLPKAGSGVEPFKWQETAWGRWTQKDRTQVAIGKFHPFSWPSVENAFAYSIITSDSFRKDVQQAMLRILQRL